MSKKRGLPIYSEQVSQDLANRLKRAEGQVRGIARMLEEQRPCVEVLEQFASVQAALRGAANTVLRNYLERCATEAIRADDPAIYDEMMDAIYKFAK